MDQRIVVGIVGYDKRVNVFHIPYLLCRQDRFLIRKIYTIGTDVEEREAEENIQYTNRLIDLIDDPEIDLILVNTPIGTHEELIWKILENRKHCIVEKPFVFTAIQAENLFRFAEEKGCVLQVYQNRRYDSDYLTLKRVLDSGFLGSLSELELCYENDYLIDSESSGFHLGYPGLYDCGADVIDQIISLFGEPDDISYNINAVQGAGHGNDYLDIDLFYKGLKVSARAGCNCSEKRPGMRAIGSRGSYIKRGGNLQNAYLQNGCNSDSAGFGTDRTENYGTLSYYEQNGTFHEEAVQSAVGDYGRFYDAVYECIRLNGAMPVDPRETIQVYEILEEGLRQAYRHYPAANGGRNNYA